MVRKQPAINKKTKKDTYPGGGVVLLYPHLFGGFALVQIVRRYPLSVFRLHRLVPVGQFIVVDMEQQGMVQNALPVINGQDESYSPWLLFCSVFSTIFIYFH